MIGIIICGLLALPVVYHTVCYIVHLMKLRNYPHGLFPLPVIGNLHQMGEFGYEDFAEWSKIYGDVFSISFGMKRIVIVNGFESAKECLVINSKAFAGRNTDQYLTGLLTDGFQDLIFSDYGDQWSFLRKLGHMALRTHVDGSTMNERTRRECKELRIRLLQENGRPVSVKEQFGK